MNEVRMFSKREQRWIPDIPVPYPPFWWERVIHFLKDMYWPHSIEAIKTCRICQEVEYKSFNWYHAQDPK